MSASGRQEQNRTEQNRTVLFCSVLSRRQDSQALREIHTEYNVSFAFAICLSGEPQIPENLF